MSEISPMFAVASPASRSRAWIAGRCRRGTCGQHGGAVIQTDDRGERVSGVNTAQDSDRLVLRREIEIQPAVVFSGGKRRWRIDHP